MTTECPVIAAVARGNEIANDFAPMLSANVHRSVTSQFLSMPLAVNSEAGNLGHYEGVSYPRRRERLKFSE